MISHSYCEARRAIFFSFVALPAEPILLKVDLAKAHTVGMLGMNRSSPSLPHVAIFFSCSAFAFTPIPAERDRVIGGEHHPKKQGEASCLNRPDSNICSSAGAAVFTLQAGNREAQVRD